jgi:hypothetical protein
MIIIIEVNTQKHILDFAKIEFNHRDLCRGQGGTQESPTPLSWYPLPTISIDVLKFPILLATRRM